MQRRMRGTCVLVLLFMSTGGCDDFPFGSDNDKEQTTATIGLEGGTVTLDGVAEAIFPAGAFPSGARITVTKERSAEWNRRFDETAAIFGASESVAYQVVIESGTSVPQSDSFDVVLNIPSDFSRQIPPDFGVEAFILLRQTGSGETLDTWELIASQYDERHQTLRVRLPSFIVAPYFMEDGAHGLHLTIAATPGERDQPGASSFNATAALGSSFAAAGSCVASTGQPLAQMTLQEGFGELRKDGNGYKLHWGVDLTAAPRTQVFAALAGRVIRAGWVNGYGNTIVIQHGPAQTLYAHLSAMNVVDGAEVTAGQVIGLTGTTGNAGGTVPHLHFEIAPRGNVFQHKNKADPLGCVSNTAEGDIVLRDNGNLADDAFVLTIDGVEILRTERGGEATQRTGPLRLGDHDLKLVCLEAPDNVGTYEVILSRRTVFKTGDQRRRSGTLPQNGELNVKITVFGTDDNNPTTPVKSLPNIVIEHPL